MNPTRNPGARGGRAPKSFCTAAERSEGNQARLDFQASAPGDALPLQRGGQADGWELLDVVLQRVLLRLADACGG
jgi:hypothetical protein